MEMSHYLMHVARGSKVYIIVQAPVEANHTAFNHYIFIPSLYVLGFYIPLSCIII